MNALERPNLPDLAESGLGVVTFCGTFMCPRAPQYIPIDRALEMFGPVTLRAASRKIRCNTCGASGENGQVSLAVSTLDVDDERFQRAYGTTERRQAERSIAQEVKDREWHEANGWPYERRYIPPMPWW